MRNRGLFLTAAVLVVAAAIVLLVEQRNQKAKDERIGKILLNSAEGADVDLIEISQGEASIKLVRDTEKVWHLNDSSGFPADAKNILRLIDDLSRARYMTLVTNKSEKAQEFGLSLPKKISMSKNATKILDLVLGQSRGNGGVYGGIQGESRIYLIDPSLYVSTDIDAWELKELLDIKKELIKSASFFSEDGSNQATLSREKPELALALIGLKEGEKESSSVSEAQSLLEKLSFSKRIDLTNEEAKTALSKPHRVVFELFDQRRYELFVGNVGQKWFLKITAESLQEDPVLKAEVKKIQDMMGQHAFEITSYLGQRFVKKHSDFIDTQAKEASSSEMNATEQGG